MRIRVAFACQKRVFDTFIENLRIFDEKEKDCGNLKIFNFPGDFLTECIIFPSLALRKNTGSPHMSLSPIFMVGLRKVFDSLRLPGN